MIEPISAMNRPVIYLNYLGEICNSSHTPEKCRIVLRQNKIHIGCTDVNVDVIRKLLSEYDKAFPTCVEKVLQ